MKAIDVKPSNVGVTSVKPSNILVVDAKPSMVSVGGETEIYCDPKLRTGMPIGLLLTLTYPKDSMITQVRV